MRASHLRRPPRRLHQQRAEHLHAQQQRHRQLLRRHQAGRQRPVPQRPGDDITGFCVPANNYGRQQLQPRTAAHRIRSTYTRPSRLGALSDQRRLERADRAELPEHGSGRLVRAIPDRLRRPGARSPGRSRSSSPPYDKDKFENTVLDGQRQDRRSEGRLHRRLSRSVTSIRRTTIRTTRAAPMASTTAAAAVPAAAALEPAAAGGPGVPAGGTTPICYSPITSWRDQVTNTHQSHEFRLSTPDDWRARGILGAYWEDFEIVDNMNFLYKTIPSCTPGEPRGRPRRRIPLRRQRRPAARHDRIGPQRAQRQHGVRRGRASRLQADRGLRLGRLRHHPEGAHA